MHMPLPLLSTRQVTCPPWCNDRWRRRNLWRWSRSESLCLQSPRHPYLSRHRLLSSASCPHPVSIAIDAGPFSFLQHMTRVLTAKHEVVCLRIARGRLLADCPRSSACGLPEVVCLRMARGRLLADGPWSSACGWPEVVCLRMAGGRLLVDGRRSSACGWPEVVCLRMARGRLLADGPRSSACGWPEVVCLRMDGGRLLADGWRSSACGWLEVVCLRMGGGRLLADGPRSSACGWPEVVCLRMARGRLLADGPRSSACGWPEVVCLRMARGRLLVDGPWSSACGRPVVVCLRMAGEVVCGWPGRSSADGRGSSADGDWPSWMVNVEKWVRSGSALAGNRPLGRLLDPRLAEVLFFLGLPTTLAITRMSTKNGCAQAGTVGGCARVHECIVLVDASAFRMMPVPRPSQNNVSSSCAPKA